MDGTGAYLGQCQSCFLCLGEQASLFDAAEELLALQSLQVIVICRGTVLCQDSRAKVPLQHHGASAAVMACFIVA